MANWCANCCPRWPRRSSPAMWATTAAPSPGAARSTRAWPTSAATRVTARGRCRRVSWALMMEGAIQVNSEGRRFHDETQGYSEAAVKVLAQPGGIAWDIFDDALLAFAQQFPDFREAQAAGAVRSAAEVDA